MISRQAQMHGVDDSVTPFLRIPWTATLLSQPNIVIETPNCRVFKASTEDSYYAEILKTSRTIRSCIAFWRAPSGGFIDEVTVLYILGDGMNGHPQILHGGVTATMLDESMGIFQYWNLQMERQRTNDPTLGALAGQEGLGTFTAYLNVRYLRPVRTPGAVAVRVRRAKREGRKEFLSADLLQWSTADENEEGEMVVCGTGEALFVFPKSAAQEASKL